MYVIYMIRKKRHVFDVFVLLNYQFVIRKVRNSNLVRVSQISGRIASGPTGVFRVGGLLLASDWVRNYRRKALSASATDKLGNGGNPGFQTTLLRHQCAGLLLVADAPQGRQHVRE